MTTYIYSIYNYFFGEKEIATELETEKEKEKEIEIESTTIEIKPVFDKKDIRQQIESDLIDNLLIDVTPVKLVDFYTKYDQLMKQIVDKPVLNLKPLIQTEWKKPIVEPYDPEFKGYFNILDLDTILADINSESELEIDSDWDAVSDDVTPESDETSESSSDSDSDELQDCVE